MSVCERCTENHNCAWQNHEGTICHERPAFPLTNADRIRAMKDEELAKYISKHVYCPTCPIHEMCRNDDSATSCDEIICEWLKQESEGK